jgi:hypothetical protein
MFFRCDVPESKPVCPEMMVCSFFLSGHDLGEGVPGEMNISATELNSCSQNLCGFQKKTDIVNIHYRK